MTDAERAALLACPRCGEGKRGRDFATTACAACEAALLACPPCDDPAGHQFDDDRSNIMYGLEDVNPPTQIGDPCMWCAHEKCSSCPPPRGEPFEVLHERGEEECWSPDCTKPLCVRYRHQVPFTQGASDV